MFNIPVIRSDHSSYENSSKRILKRRLKKVELGSLRSDQSKLIIPKNADENSDYVGLLTGDIYKKDDLEIDDISEEIIEKNSPVQTHRHDGLDSASEDEYIPSDDESPDEDQNNDNNDKDNKKELTDDDSDDLQSVQRPGSFFHRRSYDVYNYGLEELPRPVSPMRIVRDSPLTTAMVYENNASLSSKARKVVSEKAFYDESGSFHVTNDDKIVAMDTWSSTMSLRVRHIYNINTIMHLALLRGDYSTASRAFSLMIRLPMVDLRLIWTVGLELLVWKRERRDAGLISKGEFTIPNDIPNNNDAHTARFVPGSKTEDENFLQWLIINFPYYKKLNKELTNIRSRADEFNSHLIYIKLRHEDPESALDRLQEILLETPYSEDPMYYMLAGIAVIQLACKEKAGVNDELRLNELSEKAREYFDKCLKYGGVYPIDFIDLEIESITQPERADFSNTNYDESMSISSPMSPDQNESKDPEELDLEFDFSDEEMT